MKRTDYTVPTEQPKREAPCLEKATWMVMFSELREINLAELGLSTHGP